MGHMSTEKDSKTPNLQTLSVKRVLLSQQLLLAPYFTSHVSREVGDARIRAKMQQYADKSA